MKKDKLYRKLLKKIARLAKDFEEKTGETVDCYTYREGGYEYIDNCFYENNDIIITNQNEIKNIKEELLDLVMDNLQSTIDEIGFSIVEELE